MKEIHRQLPLLRYQSMLNPRWQLCLRNECSCCKNGTLHILKNILDFKGVPMDIPTLIDFTVRSLQARESLHAECLARPVNILLIQS